MIDVIIPAAGSGVRFHELGKQYPKCVLPYEEKPIIVHNIKKILEIKDVEKITITVHHQSEKIIEVIESYFPELLRTGRIKFTYLEKINNFDGVVSSIVSGLSDSKNSVLIILSDIVVESDLDFVSHTKESFISVKQVSDWQRWCMVKRNNGQELQFFDKQYLQPKTNNSVSGIYFLTDSKYLKFCAEKTLNTSLKDPEFSQVLLEYQEKHPIDLLSIDLIDFGTLEEYQKNRGVSNHRSFNNITFSNDTVIKSSTNKSKIINEINWFKTMPTVIQYNLPRLFEYNVDQNPSYTLERLDSPTLKEWFLFLDSDIGLWNDIFDQTFSVIDKFTDSIQFNSSTFFREMLVKTQLRIDSMPTLDSMDIIDKLQAMLLTTYVPKDTLFHGDMCFSNIFYNQSKNQIKLIDPNGQIQGNILYDYAKLMSSVIYDYDFIDAELVTTNNAVNTILNSGKNEIKDLFWKKLSEKLPKEQIKLVILITASLFLTMIPLHSHNKTNQLMYYECFKRAVNDAYNYL